MLKNLMSTNIRELTVFQKYYDDEGAFNIILKLLTNLEMEADDEEKKK